MGEESMAIDGGSAVIGLDVGSTAVKAVVFDRDSRRLLWQDYRRHETRQFETCLDFLARIEAAFPGNLRVFTTGSGGAAVGQHIGAVFQQEVSVMARYVERHYPDIQSVVELGGQDAKMVIFATDPRTGKRKKTPTMNDKCAGGTGAVIDKIAAKLRISPDGLESMPYAGVRLHPVAGKCGVFAETDINSLQKQGVHAAELMASLFESVVLQNLSVLTRGHTLRPRVLLLGGPNQFIKGLQECWRFHIPRMWAERGVDVPAGVPVEELIVVPEHALYFGALGAAECGMDQLERQPDCGTYQGAERLRWYIETGRGTEHRISGGRALVRDEAERHDFERRYTPAPWTPASFPRGTRVEAYLGLDGGSTSTKAVLLGRDKTVLAKAYQLSCGNPIEDTQQVFESLRR
ncbi:MAG: hypothetical protein QG656_2091, partial [Candidatus Hydrogenedentes bacterium]|nr:hypothetical protein [Candidatus Hydrogenedentota bacterium]